MKIGKTYLITLLVLVVAACQNAVLVLPKPKTFKLPRTEEQMLVWLKEHNYEVEELGENRYSISWKEELPDGEITDITRGRSDSDICKVLIESKSKPNSIGEDKDGFSIYDFLSNYENTAHFTFPLRLGINADVIVSSSVELVETHPLFPMYRYNYQIQNLQTSRDPVETFQIYYSSYILTHRDLRDLNAHKDLNDWMVVNSPSNLWETSEVVNTGIEDYKGSVWRSKDLGILPGESQHGFSIQLRGLPDIVLAGIDIDGRKGEESDLIVKIDEKVINNWTDAQISVGYDLSAIPVSIKTNRDESADINGMKKVAEILLQSRPQGKVIGPRIIPDDWRVSELTQRLETLTSQSVTEGWLDESTAKQLKKHLAKSQSALQKGQQSQAKQAIQTFADALKKMEINVNLTQEAATLLGTNAAYLLTRF